MSEQIERLTIEGVEVGERVRRIGGKLIGTVTKKYAQKIAIDYDGTTAEGYPAEFERVADEAPLFEGGDWREQEEQQQAEAPSVAAQIADLERQIADAETLIACESGPCRYHAIEARHYLSERLRALVWAIESRDLGALTAIVAAGNRARVAA